MKNNLIYLVSVTIGEFQVISESGLLRLEPSRMITASGDDGGLEKEEIKSQLDLKLPQFSLNEEHSVLILVFKRVGCQVSSQIAYPSGVDGRVILQARHCSKVLPLTRRAKEILEGRFGETIKLGKPIFESTVDFHLREQDRARRFTGAEAIVEILIANPDVQLTRDLASRVSNLESEENIIIGGAQIYTRRDPMPKEPISGLRDLGKVIIGLQSAQKKDTLRELSAWIKPKCDKLRGYKGLYSDPALMRILNKLEAEYSLPVPTASLGIFLHWRELALSFQSVDLYQIQLDCRELSKCVSGRTLVGALWLLGYNAGFESFSEAYYAGLGVDHPFAPNGKTLEKVIVIEPSSLPEVQAGTKETTEAAVSDQDQTIEEKEQTVKSDVQAESKVDKEAKPKIEETIKTDEGEPKDLAEGRQTVTTEKTEVAAPKPDQAIKDKEDAEKSEVQDEPKGEKDAEPKTEQSVETDGAKSKEPASESTNPKEDEAIKSGKSGDSKEESASSGVKTTDSQEQKPKAGNGSAKKTAAKKAPIKKAPIKNTAAKKAPVKKASVKKAPAKPPQKKKTSRKPSIGNKSNGTPDLFDEKPKGE